MLRLAVPAATVLLVGTAAVPAAAEPVSLNDACAATLAILANTGGSNDAAIFAGSRFSVGNRVIAADGTYGIISQELTVRERKAALKYLGATSAVQSWFNEGSYFGTEWNDSYAAALAQASGLPADCAAAAGPLTSSNGSTYYYANATVDIVDGAVTGWDGNAFTFGPQQLALPPGPSVAYAVWRKPAEAASLNSTLRTMSRSVVQELVEPTPRSIDARMRAVVDPDRAVPIRVTTLRKGALASARNPYTKTYHAWRVYLKRGEAVARKVAP